MRLSSFSWAVLAMAGMSPLASACAFLTPSPARDAQTACERKKDGSSCFLAGTLVSESAGEMTPEAIRLYTRGCAARNSSSCEMLANVKGPLREQALVDACNGGDLMSCNRRANEFPNDEKGRGEARALRHSACKQSVNVKPGMSAREIEGIAESCAALARMIASGEGGARDAVAASKLDVLAATLRAEALYQHEREDDAKILPHPAQVAAAPAPRRGGIKREPKPDPTAAEREKFRREYEARRAAREAWMSSVDASLLAMQKKASRGDPTVPSLSALERATTAPGATAGVSRCQGCVDTCGTMAQCTGDDFVGGHCGQLRTADNSAFDTCVAECAAKVDACTKACECAPEPAPAKGGR
jgi:TPR repeat protein